MLKVPPAAATVTKTVLLVATVTLFNVMLVFAPSPAVPRFVGATPPRTVMVWLQVLWQPLASVIVRLSVKVPLLAPALTLTDWLVVEPLVEAAAPPLLLIDQL